MPTRAKLHASQAVETWLKERGESRCVALEIDAGCAACWRRGQGDPPLTTDRSNVSAAADVVIMASPWADVAEAAALYLAVRIGPVEHVPAFASLNYRLLDFLQRQPSLRLFVVDNDVDLSNAIMLDIAWGTDQRGRAQRAIARLTERARRGGVILADFHAQRRDQTATYEVKA
jgi:hypothetical protein